MNTKYKTEIVSDWLTNELYIWGWYYTDDITYEKEQLTVHRAAIDTLIEQLQEHKAALDKLDQEYLEYMKQEDARMAENDRNKANMPIL
jgi:hypothetical protein